MSKRKMIMGLGLAWLYRKLTDKQTTIFLECSEAEARTIAHRLKNTYPEMSLRIYFAEPGKSDEKNWRRLE